MLTPLEQPQLSFLIIIIELMICRNFLVKLMITYEIQIKLYIIINKFKNF